MGSLFGFLASRIKRPAVTWKPFFLFPFSLAYLQISTAVGRFQKARRLMPQVRGGCFDGPGDHPRYHEEAYSLLKFFGQASSLSLELCQELDEAGRGKSIRVSP